MSVDKDMRSSLGERRVREMKKMMKKKNAPYFFLAPMLVLFAVFMIYPIIDSLILSFQDFTEGNYVFCGLQNYITMFHDPVFWKSLKNTFIYLAVQVPVMVVLSLLLGVLVEQAFLKFRSGFRMSIFLPSVTALVAYAIVFKLLFNTDFGLVNHALTALGFDGVDWLNTVWGARSAIIITRSS